MFIQHCFTWKISRQINYNSNIEDVQADGVKFHVEMKTKYEGKKP